MVGALPFPHVAPFESSMIADRAGIVATPSRISGYLAVQS
jgi:hypothetical protein